MKTLAEYNLKDGDRLYSLMMFDYAERKKYEKDGYIEDKDLDIRYIRIVSIIDNEYYLLDYEGDIKNVFSNPSDASMFDYVLIKKNINPKSLLINKIIHK